MNVSEWAKREVELACKREREIDSEDSLGAAYGCACYESALKALNSLCEDGHSGCSIEMTKHILNRLIDGKPLTPIVDTEDVWNLRPYNEKTYQCTRMSSLFKTVDSDGSIQYDDVDRVICVDIDHGTTYNFGLVRKIVNEMYPITMPYYPPNKSIKVYCSDCLTYPENGDFDTVAILYLMDFDGIKKDINRYFKSDEGDNGWIEISQEEYEERVIKARELISIVESSKVEEQ